MKVFKTKFDVILIFVLILGGIFRTYNFEKSFSFAHDQDLYSWIAKDIVINHHIRSIGQVTSVDGVFIGPFYYYLMAFFYAVGGMNPMIAVIPLTLIGLFNIWSLYFVTKKCFGIKTARIAAIIESISFGMAYFDRWSVPTQPTITWSIWFWYTIWLFYKKEKKGLLLYGVLLGFVWHIHIALLPILIIPVLAFITGNKTKIAIYKWLKYGLIGLFAFVIISLPFWVFEIRHDFSQTKSIVLATKIDRSVQWGWSKAEKVVNASAKEIQQRLLFGYDGIKVDYIWLTIIVGIVAIIALKIVETKVLILMLAWIILVLGVQFLSKRLVSEYYFTNMIPIVILLASLVLSKLNYKLLLIAGLFYFSINRIWLIKKTNIDESYYYRRQTVEYIKKDVTKNNYPCISINYIAGPGSGVGFRYLFWYEGIKVIKSSSKVASYDIVIPWQTSASEIKAKFGRFGVIVPRERRAFDSNECNKPENELDPLLGFTGMN